MDERLTANRANWDERTGIHLDSTFYDVEGWLRRAPGPRPREVDALGDVAGLSLVHLQCHIGLDTLQFARAGARVTGLDFSPAAIDAARGLAERAGLANRAHFVCADVCDAFHALGAQTFDIVYVSLGALCWLPSVDRWAEQAAALVTPGGRLYLHDQHPVEWALADDQAVFAHPYFEESEPYVDDSGVTYADSDRPLVNRRNYQWNHGIGETVTALIRHGLQLDWLVEHDWTVVQRSPWLVASDKDHWTTPPGMPRLPLTFSLLAHRPPVPLTASRRGRRDPVSAIPDHARIVYRAAQPDDADDIARLWSVANRARGAEARDSDVPIVRGRIIERGAIGFVAEDDGEIVGTVVVSPGREDARRGKPIAGLAHLNGMAVAPDRWGRGIARTLLDLIVERARSEGFAQIQLYVDDDNPRARDLYERNDWNATGEVVRDEHVTHLRYLRSI